MAHHPRLLTFLSAFLLAGVTSFGEKADHIQWSVSLEPVSVSPSSKVQARMTGQFDPGWHIYSLSTLGAIPTTIHLEPNPAVASYRVLQPAPHRAFDPGFNSDTETFDREVTFLVELALTKDAPGGSHEIALEVRYQSCSDKICIPPVRRRAAASLIVDPAVQRIAPLDSGRLLGGVAGSANT